MRESYLHAEEYISSFNQKLENCQIRNVWNELIQRSDYENRKLKVEAFNKYDYCFNNM